MAARAVAVIAWCCGTPITNEITKEIAAEIAASGIHTLTASEDLPSLDGSILEWHTQIII
jgi:hypothetical protein